MVRIKYAEEFSPVPAKLKVIGLGGAGGNAINRMAEAGVRHVELIAANTDSQDLRRSKAHVRMQLGEELTRGLGVGGDPQKGRLAAEESRERLGEVLGGSDLVFITAGMGGGTGTGAAPVAAQVAREANALTLGVVTRPFHFEGQLRAQHAESGIKELRSQVDTLLVIPNDRLFEVSDERTSTEEAFRKADDVLRQAIQSISDVITTGGTINMDLNDIKAIMTGAGEALMGVGEASGSNRALEAAKEAVTSPLLENVSIDGAKGLIVNIVGNSAVPLADVKDAMDFVSRTASPDAKIKFGQACDEALGDRLRVTVIATGFPPQRARGHRQIGTGRLTKLGPLRHPIPRETAPIAPTGPRSAPAADWTKPAFLRWKVRKLR